MVVCIGSRDGDVSLLWKCLSSLQHFDFGVLADVGVLGFVACGELPLLCLGDPFRCELLPFLADGGFPRGPRLFGVLKFLGSLGF